MANNRESSTSLVSDGVDANDGEPEISGCGGTICFNPYRGVYRFVALFFLCFLSFGNYFCYDNPAALADNISSDLDLTKSQYGILYSVYSWPNVILAFFGGFVMDRFIGIRAGAILFSFFIMAGQLLFATGAYTNLFWLVGFGRFVFAIGGESLAVAQNTYAVKWFKGKELNTVFGIQLSFARIGSTVNMYVMKPLYDAVGQRLPAGYKTLGATLLLAGLTTVFSFCCALILGYLDYRRDKYLAMKEKLIKERSDNQEEEEEKPVIHPRDILTFPLTMWLLCIICVTYYVVIFPLVSYGLLFFESKYLLTPYSGDVCDSLIYLISIVASPLAGFMVDQTGRNLLWMCFAVLLATVGHLLLAFSFITPFVPMVILGLSYSLLAASLWPCLAYLVPEKSLGTAYGVMQSIQNLGLALLFLSVGPIIEARGYIALEIYFLAFLCVSIGAVIMLIFVDSAKTGVLNMSKQQRIEFLHAGPVEGGLGSDKDE